jgi:hypothetical protein
MSSVMSSIMSSVINSGQGQPAHRIALEDDALKGAIRGLGGTHGQSEGNQRAIRGN